MPQATPPSFANKGILGIHATSEETGRTLEAFADFWKIPYARFVANASPVGVVFSSGMFNGSPETPVVLCPSGVDDAQKIADTHGMELKVERDVLIEIRFSREVSASIRTSTYNFLGPKLQPVFKSGNTTVLSRIAGQNRFVLSVDLVSEYSRLMRGIEDRPHRRFVLVSKLGAYTLIPQFVRNRAFRDKGGLGKLRPDTIAPVECLRVIFLATIVKASSHPVLTIGFWKKGKDHALAVTHDVETRQGLTTGCWRLFDVEEKFGIRSTWNVPSNRYPLDEGSLSKLAVAGELGGHDTKHDGKLILASPEQKVRRLLECRETLERASGRRIAGFRSPLLQHSSQLVEAMGEAGFTHDSSIPSWEVLSPTSLGPHGVGTIFPFELSGVVEVPVTLPQDHQLLRVIGLSPKESVDALHRLADWVHGLGGPGIILVHPDYEFAHPENKAEYQRLLNKFANDAKCDIMTINELSNWWSLRSSARWVVEHGQLRLDAQPELAGRLSIRLVEGYDDENGFKIEEYS